MPTVTLHLAMWEYLVSDDRPLIVLVVALCLFIMVDTRTPSKALAYLLLVVAVPVGGRGLLPLGGHQLPQAEGLPQEARRR